MIRVGFGGVLLSVLALSIPAAAVAQEDRQPMAKVICAGDPECEALAAHRLTAENLRTLFAVDRELIALMKEVPDLRRRMEDLARSLDPHRRLGEVTLNARVHEGIPEIADVLRRHQMSAREYMFTHAVAMVTAMTDIALGPAGRGTPPEVMTPALRFWRSMDPALKAEADAWTKMRGYDHAIDR